MLFGKWSFRSKLTAIIFLVAMIASVISISSIRYVVNDITKQQVRDSFGRYQAFFEKSIQAKVVEIEKQADVISKDPLIKANLSKTNTSDKDLGLGDDGGQDLKKVRSLFQSADFNWSNGFDFAAIVNADGSLIYFKAGAQNDFSPIRSGSLLAEAMKKNSVAGIWSGSEISEGNEALLPKSEGDKQFLTVASAVFTNEKLSGFLILGQDLQKAFIDPNADVVDGKIKFISVSGISAEFNKSDSVKVTLAGDQLEAESLLHIKTNSGKDDLPFGGLIYRKDVGPVLKEIHGKINFISVAALVLMFFMAILAAKVFSSVLMKPLEALKKAIHEFGAGNYDYKVEVTGNDDISNLGITFNYMLEAFNKTKIDSVTGLMNQKHFGDVLNQWWDKFKAEPANKFALAQVEIKLSSMAAETLSKSLSAGDLKLISATILKALKTQDVVGRHSQQRITCLIAGEEAEEISGRFLKAIEELKKNDKKNQLFISVGVCMTQPEFVHVSELVTGSQAALEEAMALSYPGVSFHAQPEKTIFTEVIFNNTHA